tara:strand:+ start:944 stop:5005 length:4062 start_codon:yes stop_codon:yes gene_type:complete
MKLNEFDNSKDNVPITKKDAALYKQAQHMVMKSKIDQKPSVDMMQITNKGMRDYVGNLDKDATKLSKAAGIPRDAVKPPKPLTQRSGNFSQFGKTENAVKEAGVGKITKQNTTPDVKPGETERQAKKLFPMNKDGKPKPLGVKGATPNQAFNLGLSENISVTGTETRRAEKKKGIEVGTPEWFKHWFDLPYLREDITKKELLAQLKDQQRGRYIQAMLDTMHKLVQSKGDRHSIGSYAFEVAKSFGFSPKTLEKMYRDIHNMPLDSMVRTEDVTQGELNALERVIDNVFSRIGIDVEFTRHFIDRANDDRNGEPITIQELGRLFAKEYKRWGKPIAQLGPDAEAVMKDLESDINIPFALRWNGKELEMIAKTVMRKKNFKTSNKQFPVESLKNGIFDRATTSLNEVRGPNLLAMINAIADELGVSPTVARAIAYQESGHRHTTKDGKVLVGDVKLKNKAYGAFQVRSMALADVNRLYKTNYTMDDLKNDPSANVRVGLLYFKAQKEFYGAKDDRSALQGYNGGPGAIKGGKEGANNYAEKVLGTASADKPETTPRAYDDPKNPNPQVGVAPIPKPNPRAGDWFDDNVKTYEPKAPVVQPGPPLKAPGTFPDPTAGDWFDDNVKTFEPPKPAPGISKDTTVSAVTYQDLAKSSGIKDPNLIQVGGKVTLPGNRTYTIRPGDTLSGIAKNYNSGAIVSENVPSTNKAGTIGQHINWAGKNKTKQPASDKDPKSWWQTVLAKGKGMFEDDIEPKKKVDIVGTSSVYSKSTQSLGEDEMLTKQFEITPELAKLNNIFNRGGYEIRVVGGAVRDLALNKTPKDIDLASDATPTEMQKMFDDAGVKHIPTGIEHGTITAIINSEEFEITTLRADVETDGRRAEVEFVRSWEEDAKRRDLTYNAMSIDFEGNLYDYHGGMDDLQDKVTRFVGDPEERIKEDYLRTLRYFRFQGRLDNPTFDDATLKAISDNANGLKQLSVERVWMEISKILSGNNIEQVLDAMAQTGVTNAIGLQVQDINTVQDGGDPVINLARITNDESVGPRWKMSNDEKSKLGFLIQNKGQTHDKKWYTDQMADGFDRGLLDALARFNHQDDMIQHVKLFKAPEFPVGGNDLMQLGHERGPKIGQTLQALRTQWKQGNFSANKDELLKGLDKNKVNEAMDNPYPYTLEGPSKIGTWVGKADTPNGPLVMDFDGNESQDDFSIDFSVNRRMGLEGTGDAFRIFATVVAIMNEWISKVGIERVQQFDFNADKEEHDSDGRSKLYDRFAKKLANQLGWSVRKSVTGNGSTDFFSLQNPNPQKNENFADGKKPGRKGLSKRVGIPKDATLAQLEKIAKNSDGEKRRMAQWQLNMRRGKNKK